MPERDIRRRAAAGDGVAAFPTSADESLRGSNGRDVVAVVVIGPGVSRGRTRTPAWSWNGAAGCRAAGLLGLRRKSRPTVPALSLFPRKKEIWGAASMPQGLRLVEPVVFYGIVHRAGGQARGQKAQLQDVLELAGARGDGVFLGHADLIGHSWGPLPGVSDGGVLSR